MQKNSIQPSSPIQTRQFLLENEEILYIGSAKEKLNHLNLIDRTRWIALTDLGRLLIMHRQEETPSLQSTPKARRKSLISSFIPQRTGSNKPSRNSSGTFPPDKQANSPPASPAMRRLSSREPKSSITTNITISTIGSSVDDQVIKVDLEIDEILSNSPTGTPVERRMSSNTTKASRENSNPPNDLEVIKQQQEIESQTSSRNSMAMRRLSLKDPKSSNSSKATSRKNSVGVILPFDPADNNDEDSSKAYGMYPRRKSMKESKSGTSSSLASRNHSFLIEEENVYIANGIKERRTLVINQFDQLESSNVPVDSNEHSRETIPSTLSLLEVVQIDKICEFSAEKNMLLISRLDQKIKLTDFPAEEWHSRIEMAMSLTV